MSVDFIKSIFSHGKLAHNIDRSKHVSFMANCLYNFNISAFVDFVV